MPHWPTICSASLLFAGCADSGVLFLSYPEVLDHASMVLAVDSDSGSQLIAIDLSVGLPTLRLVDALGPEEGWQAHALLFSKDLAALKLNEGLLAASPAGEAYPILLTPDALFTQSSADEAANQWRSVPTPPMRFNPLRIENDDPYGFCPELNVAQVEMPGTRNENVRFMLSLTENEVLVGLTPSLEPGVPELPEKLFVVRLVGEDAVLRELALPEGTKMRAATRDREGRFWVAALGGQLFELRLGQAEAQLTAFGSEPTPSLPDPNWLYVGPNAVLMMGTDGVVRGGTRTATDGLSWNSAPLYEFPNGLDVGLGSGAMLERPNGELWLVKGSARTVVRLRHEGGVFSEPQLDTRLEGEAAIGLSALGELERLGVLVGMTDGEIRRFDETKDTWETLGLSRFTQVVSVIAETKNGFLMAGGTGLFNFYVSPEGYCPLEANGYKGVRAPNTVRLGRPLGNGFLLGGPSAFGSTAALTWLRL